MRCHIGAFQHLSESPKRPDKAFDDLERGLRALAEAVRQAIRIIRIHPHPARPTHPSIHPPHPADASVHGAIASAKATVHRVTHRAKPGVWGCVVAIAADAAIWSRTEAGPRAVWAVVCSCAVDNGIQGRWSWWKGGGS